MKQVFVATSATSRLTLSPSFTVAALLPRTDSEKHSYALGEDGKLVRVSGARIAGRGIAHGMRAAGYVPAQADDERAHQLLAIAHRASQSKFAEEAGMFRAAFR